MTLNEILHRETTVPEQNSMYSFGSNRLAKFYARRAVKVNVDNLAATAVGAAAAAMAIDGQNASALELVAISTGITNLVHPFLYAAFAVTGNYVLSKTNVSCSPVGRELAQGYASGFALSLMYTMMTLPVQHQMISNGVDPANTIFWSNVLATAVISPFRGVLYVGLDNLVSKSRKHCQELYGAVKKTISSMTASGVDV